MNNILRNIEALRIEKGLKQEVIAELLGLKQATYSHYIHSRRALKYSTLLQIGKVLGVEVIDIITYPDKYVLNNGICYKCEEKDAVIKKLNNYITMLEARSVSGYIAAEPGQNWDKKGKKDGK